MEKTKYFCQVLCAIMLERNGVWVSTHRDCGAAPSLLTRSGDAGGLCPGTIPSTEEQTANEALKDQRFAAAYACFCRGE